MFDAPARPDTVPTAGPAAVRGARWRALLSGQWGVAALAVAVGVAAWVFALGEGLPLLYADARSHLSIARRVMDGPNASMVQLGTVWLPLPHLLAAPFALVGPLWRTGAAVAALNVACLVVEAVALFRIVGLASRSRLAGWVAVLALVANPGWLYLHVTSLGEPVVFAALLGTVAGLSGWVASKKAYSGGELALFVGAPAAAGVLSRYDGWAMAAAAGVFVAVGAQLRWRQWRWTWRCVRAYAVLPALAAGWWFWFNWVNWGDPLEFQRGEWSAQAQQDILDRAGLLPDKGDLSASLHTFGSASLAGATWLVAVAGVAGMCLWVWRGRAKLSALAPWLLVAVPAGFYVLSLYSGQIALRLGDGPDGSMFNLRYGLQVLPGLAAFAGLGAAALAEEARGAARVAVAAAAAVVVLAGPAQQMVDWRQVPVVAEGLQQRELAEGQWRASGFLADRLGSSADRGGLVAIDDSVNPMLPAIGVDLDRVAAPFSGPEWSAVLDDASAAEWLFVDSANGGDALARAVATQRRFEDDFELVFSHGTISVFHAKAAR